MQTTIIIPCYNEASRLKKEEFIRFASEHPQIDFLFVNDGSTDNTLQVLMQMANQNERIHYLDINPNVGKAEAVRKGMLYAVNHYPSEYFAFYDADMATPLEDLLKMVQILASNNLLMVTGCRFKRMGGEIQRSYSRFFIGRIFATCAAHILCLPVYDTQCGAKAFSQKTITILFDKPFVSQWLFDVELFARMILKFGYQSSLTNILEYPLSKWVEVGDSKLKFKDVLRQPLNLLKINNHYKIRKYVKSSCN